MTPMTSRGVPFMLMILPTIAGSEPYWLSHRS